MSVGIPTGRCGFSDTGVHSRGFSDTAGQQFSTNFENAFRLPHHGGGGQASYEQGWCGQSGQNSELFRLGKSLVQTGEQMVQEGQRLIQQGDTEDGMQLVNEGAMLEQQGALLEARAEGGGPTMPVGLNPGGQDPRNPMNPMMPVGLNPGGQDPCCPTGPMMPGLNPMDGQGFSSGGPYGTQFPTGMNGFGGGYGQNCGCGQLSVNGNTVNTSNYTIAASTDASGTLTVTDNCTGKSFKVWGDPHISTDNGGTADFQHAPATFMLGDGTRITVDPTNNPGVNTINNVTITKGNDAVTMTGFTNGNIQTQHLSGEGYYLDQTTAPGTVLTTQNGQPDELMLPNGTEIADGKNVGNIDQYATSNTSQLASQIQQSLAQIEQAIGQIEQGSFMSIGLGGLVGSKFC